MPSPTSEAAPSPLLATFHADIAQDSPRLRYALECWTGLNRAATRRWLRGDATRNATQELLASTLEHVLRTFGAPTTAGSRDTSTKAVSHAEAPRPLRGPIQFPSSSQCSATFLLGCTRGGSPGIFG